MEEKLKKKLNKRIEEGTLRSLSHFEGFVDFFSNDYLGFSSLNLEQSHHVFGGGGSRLISGTTERVIRAENNIAKHFNAPAAVMFNSGYDANIGLFSALPQRGDVVLFDELIHASVRDGIRLSFANSQSFKHNDVEDLERKLSKIDGACYVAVESLYSMDGDMAPLRGVAELCKKYHAYLIVDEAHAAGVFGDKGRGIVSSLGLEDLVFARLITFGKAYGSHGGCVLGSKELIDYLINFSRSFIYTTALPEYVYERNAELVIAEVMGERRTLLQQNLHQFRSQLNDERLISESNSPIQIVRIGDAMKTKDLAERLQSRKLAVKPIYSPTVLKGNEGIRLCIHSYNTDTEIEELISALQF